MRLTVKDAGATILTALIVLTFAATHEGWDVWLVGSSHRSAAAVIGLLGMLSCGLGRPEGRSTRFLALLGVATFVFLVLALVTGSLTWLSLLVAADVALWIGATVRHVVEPPHAVTPA
jgi:hypothetical protein